MRETERKREPRVEVARRVAKFQSARDSVLRTERKREVFTGLRVGESRVQARRQNDRSEGEVSDSLTRRGSL